jgi:protein xylosyltransferase
VEAYRTLDKSIIKKIVYFLIVNDRVYERQIYRMLKRIYHKDHYYYIHIDKGSTYLRRKLNKFVEFVKQNGESNVYIPEWSLKVNWGTPSLLEMHLKVFKELLQLRLNQNWNWDYLINLSESDYPTT